MKYFPLFLSWIFLNIAIMGNAQNITFSLAHNLINARMWHETQPLPDGNFILFGGYNGDEVNPVSYQSSEIYNYKNKTIQIGPSMNIPRYDFNSLVLHDGNIMALGGNNSSNQGILSCEIFDLLSNSWILVSSMQERHVGGKAIKLRDGRVLLVGGSTVTSEIYNSYTKLWSKVGPMNSIHGGGMTLTLLDGGQVLATGGETNPTSLELFDPSTNLWSKLPFTSIYKHQNHLAINLGGGGVLLAGSSYPDVVDQLGTEIVNPENSATIIKTGNLLGDVSFGRTVLLQNGAAFTYGIGEPVVGNTKAFQGFDNTKKTWTSIPTNSLGLNCYTLNRLPNGDFLIAGGNITSGHGASNQMLIVKQSGFEACIPPDLDISFIAPPAPICYGKPISINVNSSNADFYYMLNVGGSPAKASYQSSISPFGLTIPGEVLMPGKNNITITVVKPGCVSMTGNKTLVQDIRLSDTVTTTISLTGGSNLLCGTSAVATFGILKPVTGTYQWYNGKVGKETSDYKTGIAFAYHVDDSGCIGLASNTIELRKIGQSDISTQDKLNICLEATTIQLKGTPEGGTWQGTGVTPEGVFTPNLAGEGYITLTYNKCGYSASQNISVLSNKVVFDSKNLGLPTADTLCGGKSVDIILSNILANYSYRFFTNGQQNTPINYTSYLKYGYYFNKDTSVNFLLKVARKDQALACIQDSIIFQKYYKVMPFPSAGLNIIFPDTGCLGSNMVIKIVKPEKQVIYYPARFSNNNFEQKSPEIYTGNAPSDTLYIPFKKETAAEGVFTLKLIGTPAFSCRSTGDVVVGEKKVFYFRNKTKVSEGYYYNTGEPITLSVESNMNYFDWKIDGKHFSSKDAPTMVYNVTGIHNYTLTATSKYGCIDTLHREIGITKSIPIVSNVSCLFDTIDLQKNDYIHKLVVDKVGNTIMAGSRAFEKSTYLDKNYGFLRKYNLEGTIVWEISNPTPNSYQDKFKSMFITGITLDENNDIYISGGYCATTFKFGSIIVKHDPNYTPYSHVFVSKILKNGDILWFISTDIDNSVRPYNNTKGATDILYSNGKLYVSAKMKVWDHFKNSEGVDIAFGRVDVSTEYQVHEIDTSGAYGRTLAYTSELGNIYSLQGWMNPNPFTSSDWGKVPIFSPNLHALPNGKITFSGSTFVATTLGSSSLEILKGLQSEFTGILDPAKLGWETVRTESYTNSTSEWKTAKDLFTLEGDKISAINLGGDNQNNFLQKHTVIFNDRDSVTYTGNGSLLKRIDKNGHTLWKKLLKGVLIEQVFYSSDSTQIITVGTSQYGTSIEDGIETYGLKNSMTNKIVVFGFGTQSGNLFFAETIGSENVNTNLTSAALGPCNELLIFGNSEKFIVQDQMDFIWHGNDRLAYSTSNIYRIKIPLSGKCNSSNCTIIAGSEKISLNEGALVLFPNPASESIAIHLETAEEFQRYTIRDYAGRVVIEGSGINGKQCVNINILSSGIYFIEVISSGKRYIKKITVIK